jgi:hypothetical protein
MRLVAADVLNIPAKGMAGSDVSELCEAERLIENKAPWYRVYDIIERFWAGIREMYPNGPAAATKFETKLNDFFVEHGYGWQLVNGQIIARSEEAFETAVNTAQAELQEAGRPTAARRIHDALQALSRRPDPDSAGAISHAIAALECVAGDITGNHKATLGDVLKEHPEFFPGGLKKGLEGVWGYSCNEGARHGKEGKEPEREEAELIVALAAAVATYLSRKNR